MRRRNPGDENLRRLERLAAQGDVQAQAALERARQRTGDLHEQIAELDRVVRERLRAVGGVAYVDAAVNDMAHSILRTIYAARQTGVSHARERDLGGSRSVWLRVLTAPWPPHGDTVGISFWNTDVFGPITNELPGANVAMNTYEIRVPAHVAEAWARPILQGTWEAFNRLNNREPRQNPPRRRCQRCGQLSSHVRGHQRECARCAALCGVAGCTMPGMHPDPWGGKKVCEHCLRAMEKPGERRQLLDRAAGAGDQGAFREYMGIDELREFGARSNPDEQGDLFAFGGADRRRQAEADAHLQQLDHVAKFADAMRPDPREWEFQEPVVDTGQRDGAKCVCGHPIRYVYQVVRPRDGKKIGVGSVCIESTVPYLLQAGADGLALALQRALERQENLAKELQKKARAAKGDDQVRALTEDWKALQAFMRQQWSAYEAKARKDADYYYTPNWRRFMPDWLVESHFGSFPKAQPKIMSSPGRTAASMRTKMTVPWWYALMSPVGGMAPLPAEPKLREEVRASLERAAAFERQQAEKAAAGQLAGWEPQPDPARLKRAEYALTRF